MSEDEAEIRQLISDWMRLSKESKVEALLELMTDDAVFLLPGRAPMHKQEFAQIASTQSGPDASSMEGHSDIQEVKIMGDHAYAWAALSVVITPSDASAPITRNGHALTIFRKTAGRWRLARDANLLR